MKNNNSRRSDMFGLGLTVEQELRLIERLIDNGYNIATVVEQFMKELQEEEKDT